VRGGRRRRHDAGAAPPRQDRGLLLDRLHEPGGLCVLSLSLSAKTKVKGLLEIACAATEFEALPLRHGEEVQLRALAKHMPLSLPAPAAGAAAAAEANLLLQAHFSRRNLPTPELRGNQARVVGVAAGLIPALVDVIASEGC
jgi:pre-mRNA-splicing helicase BRR2